MALKKKFVLVLLAVCVFSGMLVNYLHRVPKRHYCDFRVYYKAGQDILHKKDIYYRESQEITPFKYSPFFAFIFAPLSLLPIKAAAGVFFGINFILTILLFRLSFHLARDAVVFSEKQGFVIYALALLCIFRYILLVWDSGQVTLLMDVFVLLCLSALIKDRQEAAGAFLAVAILIKYTPAIFLPYFILIKKPKVVLWTIIFAGLFLMLPSLVVGLHENFSYLTSWIPSIIATSLDHGSYIDCKNQSIFSMVLRFFSPTQYNSQLISLSFIHAMRVAYVLAFLLYVVALIPVKKGTNRLVIDFILIFICMILFNPNAWMTNFMGLVMPFLFLIQYSMVQRPRPWLVVAVVVMACVLINITSQSLVGADMERSGNIYSLTTMGALVLFMALAWIKFSSLPLRKS